MYLLIKILNLNVNLTIDVELCLTGLTLGIH